MLKNYSIFRDEMIARDYLALDRSILANERTLLSYLRTFVGIFSAGIAMVKLFDSSLLIAVGVVFIALAPVFLITGAVRYLQFSKKFKTLDEAAKTEKAATG